MRPPWLGRWLAGGLAPRDVRERLLDDLDEAFAGQAARHGARQARLWYFRQAIAGIPALLRMRARRRSIDSRREGIGMSAADALTQDIRHAVRFLLKSPGFTAAAVLTLALGVGANAAIFTLIKTVILQPLPYGEPGQLVMVWNAANRRGITHLSLQEIVSYRENAQSLDDLATYVESSANLTPLRAGSVVGASAGQAGGQDPERVRAAFVSANLFDTLGVGALAGRGFAPSDAEPGAAGVTVLSHGLWQRRFGGSPEVVGQTIRVNGTPRTIIGIMPSSFRLPLDYRAQRDTELMVPLVIDRANLGQWGDRSYFGVGRLKPQVDPQTATSEFKVISARWVQAGFVRDNGDGGLERAAIPVQDFLTGSVRRPLLILFGASGVVLLIACANVVSLLLAKADVRRKEVAIRAALGAGRGQIARQLLTESLVLSAVGGIVALGIAQAAIRALVVLQPANLPRVGEASVDASVLAFTEILALVTGIVFGFAPAWQLSRPNVSAMLHDVGRGGTAGRARLALRHGLVIVQLACSVVLVIGAGLLVRSLVELNRIDLGFNPRNVLTAQIQLPVADYREAADVVRFYRELPERVAALPGVVAAGAIRVLPLARTIGDWSITIQGRPAGPNENPNGDFQWVTPGYFTAMGITLLRGRFVTSEDREDTPPSVVINDTMAERYWPGQDALGKQFRMGGPGGTAPFMTIVGIIKTSRHNAVVEAPRAEMYLPHAQLPRSVGSPGRAMALVVKTEGDPLAQAGPVREVVREMNRNLPVAEMRKMDAIAADALSGPRFATLLLGVFALVAMTLAAIGIYGTISLLVSERAHEIGIRMALGAGTDVILKWILAHGLTLAAVGIAVGMAGALALSRLLETLIYGVGTLDPLTFTVVPALLGAVAVLACLIPARRAAVVDPVVTLREN